MPKFISKIFQIKLRLIPEANAELLLPFVIAKITVYAFS